MYRLCGFCRPIVAYVLPLYFCAVYVVFPCPLWSEFEYYKSDTVADAHWGSIQFWSFCEEKEPVTLMENCLVTSGVGAEGFWNVMIKSESLPKDKNTLGLDDLMPCWHSNHMPAILMTRTKTHWLWKYAAQKPTLPNVEEFLKTVMSPHGILFDDILSQD